MSQENERKLVEITTADCKSAKSEGFKVWNINNLEEDFTSGKVSRSRGVLLISHKWRREDKQGAMLIYFSMEKGRI